MEIYALIVSIISICLLVWIGFLKSDLKFYKKLAKGYRKNADGTLELAKQIKSDYYQMIELNKESIERNSYQIYLIKHLHSVIDYAGHFLKPRKKKEMYHRANQMLTFEEYTEKNKKEL